MASGATLVGGNAMQKDPQNLIVVEDEPLIAIMLMDLLEDLGWTVDGSAYTADEAFSLLAECNPKLAILDINLGQTTSLEVASMCRERGIPILFVTGYTAQDVPLECGNAPILPKPFSAENLRRAIQRALAIDPAEARPAMESSIQNSL